jgi:hypothetical protein
MTRTNTLLLTLIWIVMASINYKLGELVKAQKSIAETERMRLALEMDETTRIIERKIGLNLEQRN